MDGKLRAALMVQVGNVLRFVLPLLLLLLLLLLPLQVWQLQ
jgi:hypothetical protein